MNKKLDSIFQENWQSLSKKYIQETRIVDLIIPGTHNSNTYEIQSIGCSFAKNQIWNIQEQLKNGIRFFDLRYGFNEDKNIFIDKHGPLVGGDYFEKFRIIKEYLDTHPDEFIIIKIQAEDSLNEIQKNKFLKQLQEKIGEYLVTNEDNWFDLSKVKMKDIWKHNKRIFLVYKNYLTKFPDCENKGVFCNEGRLNPFWPDTDDTENLMQKNLEILNERQDKQELQNMLFQNSFMLTGQENFKDLIKQVIHKGLPTIENMVELLEDNKKNLNKPYNIIMVDRIDKLPVLSLLIIIQNIKSNLEIQLCYYQNQNITQQIQPYQYQNNFVCIQNFNYFLKEKNIDPSKFFLIYKYGQYGNKLYVRDIEQSVVLIYDNPLIEKQNINLIPESLGKIGNQFKEFCLDQKNSKDQLQKILQEKNIQQKYDEQSLEEIMNKIKCQKVIEQLQQIIYKYIQTQKQFYLLNKIINNAQQFILFYI